MNPRVLRGGLIHAIADVEVGRIPADVGRREEGVADRSISPRGSRAVSRVASQVSGVHVTASKSGLAWAPAGRASRSPNRQTTQSNPVLAVAGA